MNVWSHFKKKSQKGTKHLPPFCAIQQLEFLSCGLSLVPYLFKEECTRVGKAARKTWALGTPHGTEAPGEPLLSSSPLFPALAAGLGALEQDVLLGLPPAASSPASDNRAATGEEHRMLSVSFLWVPWKGFGARGCGGRQWRSKGETGQEKLLSVFWVTRGDHGDIYSQPRAEEPLVQINVLSTSGRLSIRQLPLMWSKEVTAHARLKLSLESCSQNPQLPGGNSGEAHCFPGISPSCTWEANTPPSRPDPTQHIHPSQASYVGRSFSF